MRDFNIVIDFEEKPSPEIGMMAVKGDKGDPGQDGQDGLPGKDGKDGADGLPGAKGDKGDKGDTGATGAKGDKGDKGDPGKDGHSPVVTASKSGKVTTISVDGMAIAAINDGADGADGLPGAKGDKGDKGDPGADGAKGDKGDDGYTPVKGTDYFTDADKAEMIGDVVDELDFAVTVTMTSDTTGTADKTVAEVVQAYNANKHVVFTGALGDVDFTASVTTIYHTTVSTVDVYAIQAYAVMMGAEPRANKLLTMIMPWSDGTSYAVELSQDKLGDDVVTVSGTTPTITAERDTRYICGEVVSLSFTPCANGLCDVRFTSGSTATVLTLPNTVKMPEWWDGTCEPNTVYEINIMDGVYGAVMTWEA